MIRFGKIEIDVVVKKESFKSGLKRLKFDKFLRDYLYEDLYLNNFVPESMMEELVVGSLLDFNSLLLISCFNQNLVVDIFFNCIKNFFIIRKFSEFIAAKCNCYLSHKI